MPSSDKSAIALPRHDLWSDSDRQPSASATLMGTDCLSSSGRSP
ncbi:MAG TPA: hypothetical protein V6D20_08665 [Candidatus Obscuribacterales bacterium]